MRDVNVRVNKGKIEEKNYYVSNIPHIESCQAKEIGVNELTKDVLKDLLVSLITGGISRLISFAADITNIEGGWSLAVGFLEYAAVLICLIFLVCFMRNLAQTFKLNKTGKCIYFPDKKALTRSSIKDRTSKGSVIEKLFKNEDGKILQIQGCTCPLCKSKPIGYMRPKFIDENGQIFFICDENHTHKLPFDYKIQIT